MNDKMGGRRTAAGIRGVLLALILLTGFAAHSSAAQDSRTSNTSAVRRVWVWSDSHIGLCSETSGDRDGAVWLQAAVDDIRDRVGPVVFTLSLGDVSTSSKQTEYDLYTGIRRRAGAGFGPWFEIPGNHDFAGVRDGLWNTSVTPRRRFILTDGNGVWICLGVENSGAGGKISQATLRWLREAIAANQERNIIVCTHQAVPHTVHDSKKDWRVLYCEVAGDPPPDPPPPDADPEAPKRETCDAALQRVERLVDDLRVDLWLCGHIHSTKRTPDFIARRGRTTFIDVASITQAYGNKPSCSFVLEFRDGSRTVEARYREHGTGTFDKKFSTTVEFPRPWSFSGPPQLQPAAAADAAPARAQKNKSQ